MQIQLLQLRGLSAIPADFNFTLTFTDGGQTLTTGPISASAPARLTDETALSTPPSVPLECSPTLPSTRCVCVCACVCVSVFLCVCVSPFSARHIDGGEA